MNSCCHATKAMTPTITIVYSTMAARMGLPLGVGDPEDGSHKRNDGDSDCEKDTRQGGRLLITALVVREQPAHESS
jgi:hypothetical protein